MVMTCGTPGSGILIFGASCFGLSSAPAIGDSATRPARTNDETVTAFMRPPEFFPCWAVNTCALGRVYGTLGQGRAAGRGQASPQSPPRLAGLVHRIHGAPARRAPTLEMSASCGSAKEIGHVASRQEAPGSGATENRGIRRQGLRSRAHRLQRELLAPPGA